MVVGGTFKTLILLYYDTAIISRILQLTKYAAKIYFIFMDVASIKYRNVIML